MLDALMLILIMVVNVSFVAILMRINTKHKGLFGHAGEGTPPRGPVTRLAMLMEFLTKGKFAHMNDPLLMLLSLIFIGSFLIAFPLMVLTFYYHG